MTAPTFGDPAAIALVRDERCRDWRCFHPRSTHRDDPLLGCMAGTRWDLGAGTALCDCRRFVEDDDEPCDLHGDLCPGDEG